VRRRSALVVALLLAVWSGPLAAQETVAGLPAVDVPYGAVLRLDGRLDGEAWHHAARVALADSAALSLQHDGSSIFLALRTRDERIGSICVARGAEVRVLHASMALGEVTYTAVDGGWRRGRDFAWGMRETDSGEVAEGRRAAWYAQHGWVATTAPMSRPLHVLQFRIAAPSAEEELRVAVTHLAMSGEGSVGRWPAGSDDCSRPELVMGAAPEEAEFRTGEWALVRLLSPATAPQR
jgi:hypothetical protein